MGSVRLALEIVTPVTVGSNVIHGQNLVPRDINRARAQGAQVGSAAVRRIAASLLFSPVVPGSGGILSLPYRRRERS
jgi:hypothetical protein